MSWQRELRRTLALALAGVVVLLGPGLALVDGREEVQGPRIEARHDPASCAVLHDHAACAQLSRSLALPADGVAGATVRATFRTLSPRRPNFAETVRAPTPHRPRAPPSLPA